MNRKLQLALVVALGLALSACGAKKQQVVTSDPTPAAAPTVDNNAHGTGYSQSALEALGIYGDPLQYKTVYFEYNSTAIDERSEIIALAHARALAKGNGADVKLSGHADERGTRDYNLALGERRSQAVSALMASNGTGNSKVTNVSYGEENPVDSAHNEAAWQKNRRVEIQY